MSVKVEKRVRAMIGSMAEQEFEHFICKLLPHVDVTYKNVESTLNFMGKTTPGKCDIYIYVEANDTYIPVICTTQQSAIGDKLLKDIAKIEATKFVDKVRSVILCVNTPIKDEIEHYRQACAAKGWKLEPYSLDKVVKHSLASRELLEFYFEEKLDDSVKGKNKSRRFDCGDRIKTIREEVSLKESQFIELIDFPGQKEWCAVEDRTFDLQESYIDTVSTLTGCSTAWLKHEIGAKYKTGTLYYSSNEEVNKFSQASSLSSFFVIEPKNMTGCLVIQKSEFRWKVYEFGFSFDFWNWIDDHHRIKDIFKLLKDINKSIQFVKGKIATKSQMKSLLLGERHPSQIIESCENDIYLFDDIFDIDHEWGCAAGGYAHHGEWFVKLQGSFRTYGRD